MVQYPICDLAHRLLQDIAQVAARAVIRRGKEIHPLLVVFEAVPLAEALPRGVIRVVHRYAVSALVAHHGEARHIRRPVAHVDHVVEGDGAQVGIHVVIHVFRIFQHPLVDAEKELRFRRVREHPLGEVDAAIALAELTAEHLAHVGADDGAVDQRLQPAGDDVVLHAYAAEAVLLRQRPILELAEKLRHASVVGQLGAQLAQTVIAHAINPQGIQYLLHVAQLAIPSFFAAAVVALPPKRLCLDPELREDRIFLHIVRTERFIEIKNQSYRILRHWHRQVIACSAPACK